MATTYTLIASSTVGSGGASNIEFTSITSSYTDLLVKVSARGDSGGTSLLIQFNGSTSSVYTYKLLYGTGSSVTSESGSTTKLLNNTVAQSSYTASTFGNGEIYIPNYTSSNAKSVSIDGVTENNATGSFATLTAGLWNPAVQAAITSIRLEIDGGANFVQYSTAYLYGIKNS